MCVAYTQPARYSTPPLRLEGGRGALKLTAYKVAKGVNAPALSGTPFTYCRFVLTSVTFLEGELITSYA